MYDTMFAYTCFKLIDKNSGVIYVSNSSCMVVCHVFNSGYVIICIVVDRKINLNMFCDIHLKLDCMCASYHSVAHRDINVIMLSIGTLSIDLFGYHVCFDKTADS